MAKKKPRLSQIQFKDPDLIGEIVCAHCPGDPEDPKVENAREQFSDKYFEWGDYGRVEIDLATLTGRLLPKKEWR